MREYNVTHLKSLIFLPFFSQGGSIGLTTKEAIKIPEKFKMEWDKFGLDSIQYGESILTKPSNGSPLKGIDSLEISCVKIENMVLKSKSSRNLEL